MQTVESKWKKEVIQSIDTMKEELIALSREIHAHPEVCFKEFKSSKIVSSFLEERSFEVEKGIAGLETAFRAKAKGSKGSPVVAFMAEYDAVPEIGHGCAHNLSCMASVGAGIAVSNLLPKLKGSVMVMGTPAEEGGGGKAIMLGKGAFEGVDIAMMVHACNYTKVAHDFMEIPVYRFHFKGKTAHAGAAPHEGINALDAAVSAYNAIGVLRQQIRGNSRIHVQMKQDEVALNMIPDQAYCTVVLRAPVGREIDTLVERIKRCAQAGAMATGCELHIEQLMPVPGQPGSGTTRGLRHNPPLEEIFLQNLNAQGIMEDYPDTTWVVGTDAGNISQVIPTLHPMVAICGPEINPHTKEFVEASRSSRGEEVFVSCSKAMAMTAVDILLSPEHLETIKQHHTG